MDKERKIPIPSLIDEVEARMRVHFNGYPPALIAAFDQLNRRAGKEIRPALIMRIGNIFDASQENLMDLAAAVEMMHIATLVHDELQRSPQKARFATSVTVLAGDFAFAAASKLAAATNRIIVMRKFSETLQFIVNGEITKMFSNGDGRDQAAYYRWVHAKTASLFELAAGMAATLGSASPPEIEAAYTFGYQIGMAFQIMEDILDFTSHSSPNGNPLRQGIVTLPTLLYLDRHLDGLDIGSIIKTNGNGQGHVDDLIESIRQSEAIEQARQEASRFLEHGLDILSRLPNTPERAELGSLAWQIVERDM